MIKTGHQSGFSPLIMIVFIVAILIAGVISWRVWDANQNSTSVTKNPDTNTGQDSSSAVPNDNKIFKSTIKPIAFTYSPNWTIDIKNGSEFESGFLYSPTGKKYAEFISNLHNFGSSCDDTNYTIIRSDGVTTVFPGHTIYYVEEIRGRDDNGQYSVNYALSDKVASRQSGISSGCTAYPGYFDSADNNGYVAFHGGTAISEEHFSTYEQALAYFNSTEYLEAKKVILSLRYGE